MQQHTQTKRTESFLIERAKDSNTKLEFKKENFVFVNEILESNKLQNKIVSEANSLSKTDLERQHKFEKYTVDRNSTDGSVEVYEKDSYDRKIKVCNGNEDDEEDYYVCDEKLVIPRYLIQCSTMVYYEQSE